MQPSGTSRGGKEGSGPPLKDQAPVWEKREEMHLKRWLTAVIAIPIMIFLLGYAPRWVFYAVIYLVSVVALNEFYSITAPKPSKLIQWTNCLITLLLFFFIYRGGFYFLPAFIVLWAFVPMTFLVLSGHSPEPESTGEIGKALLGPVYLCLPLAMLMIIDRYPKGNIWIFFLLCVVYAGDTGAFYFGKFFGKHKLSETLSPGKTWEGAVGGVISSFVAATGFHYLLAFLNTPPLYRLDWEIWVLVLVLCVTAQLGDLAESLLKRNHGVKDSSRVLPGHGGMLDRIDSLLFPIPILYIYLSVHQG